MARSSRRIRARCTAASRSVPRSRPRRSAREYRTISSMSPTPSSGTTSRDISARRAPRSPTSRAVDGSRSSSVVPDCTCARSSTAWISMPSPPIRTCVRASRLKRPLGRICTRASRRSIRRPRRTSTRATSAASSATSRRRCSAAPCRRGGADVTRSRRRRSGSTRRVRGSSSASSDARGRWSSRACSTRRVGCSRAPSTRGCRA